VLGLVMKEGAVLVSVGFADRFGPAPWGAHNGYCPRFYPQWRKTTGRKRLRPLAAGRRSAVAGRSSLW